MAGFFYKENKQFCYYGRGSLFEAKAWLTKAHNRKLITDDEFAAFQKDMNVIGIKLNNYINSIGTQKRQPSTAKPEESTSQ